MLKKIDVEKSVVYNNITNKLDGLYLGQIGYFSDSLSFGIYETNQLYDIVTSSSFRYRTPTGEKFTYFIPADKVVFIELKKLRPYKTLKEFPGGIGSVLTYRSKSNPSVQILTNVQSIATRDDDLLYVYMDGLRFTPLHLLTDYEYLNARGDEWKPFGVEE